MNEFNVKSTTVEKALDIVKDLSERLFGPSVEEFGLILNDNLKLRRLRNQIRNFKKVEAMVQKDGITVKQLDLKVLFPYLQGVSLEEDNDLQDAWANLIVNYIDPSKNIQVTVYPSVLAQLSTEEVKILRALPRKKQRNDAAEHIEVHASAFLNVYRLGLIDRVFYAQQPVVTAPTGPINPTHFFLTSFGLDFLQACER